MDNKKLKLVFLVFTSLFVALMSIIMSDYSEIKNVSTYSIIAFAIISGLTLFTYLTSSDSGLNNLDKNKLGNLRDVSLIQQHIDQKIAEALQKAKSEEQAAAINFSEDDKKQILANIQAKLETDAFQSFVDQIRENVTSRTKEATLTDLFYQIVRRLSGEISALSRRGNVNLILGILISLAGIMFLGYSVAYFTTEGCNSNSSEQCTEILLTYFLPRFSLVILVEIFAYFFLRLYKQSLDEIKYYQNEITNIEAKQLALQLAMRHEDQPLRTKVAEELAKTERNFILEKDQSTVEIEREKLASNNHANLINALKDIVNNKKSG